MSDYVTLDVRPCPCWFDSQTSGCVCNNEFNITISPLITSEWRSSRWYNMIWFYCYYSNFTPFCISPHSVACELMLEIMSSYNHQAHRIKTQVIGFYFLHASLLEMKHIFMKQFQFAMLHKFYLFKMNRKLTAICSLTQCYFSFSNLVSHVGH